jgi:maleylacetate reductase
VKVVERHAAALGPLSAGICDRALPFTPFEAAEEGRRAAAEARADCLVSFGGGNAVGFAKAIALELDIPIVAVPTTLSGSETTALQGTIRDGRRVQNASPRMQAKTLIYDPELTLDVPLGVLIPSGMNAMAHAVGAMIADNGNPLSRLYAREGMGILSASLRRMTQQPDDLEARTGAMYGAWLNANTLKLAPGGVNVHHKLCHVLGGGFGLPHAVVHTIVLPHSTAYNSKAVPRAMARIAAALGDGTGDAAGRLYDLERDIGASTALRDAGLPEDALDKVAEEVAMDSYYSNPRPIERDGIRALLDDAWHGRRPS